MNKIHIKYYRTTFSETIWKHYDKTNDPISTYFRLYLQESNQPLTAIS